MWQWMRHGVHGGTARFPATVVDQMAALGWTPCDEPPPDDSHLRDPDPVATPEPAVGQQPAFPPARARSAAPRSTE